MEFIVGIVILFAITSVVGSIKAKPKTKANSSASTSQPEKPQKEKTVAPLAAELTCPYCNTVLSPPPERNRKCVHCSNMIYVRSKNKIKTLLTEEQCIQYDQAKKELQEQRYQDFLNNQRAMQKEHMARVKKEFLEYQKMGLKPAFEFSGADDDRSCAKSLQHDGRIYKSLKTLPELPLEGCDAEYCRCIYIVINADD